MTKFILFMVVCSGIPGNECKPISTPIEEFDTYHQCIYFGYEQSSIKMRDIGPVEVNKYNMLIKFYCTPENII